MKQELVSIIIPSYNSAKFIVETIDSVVNQTYRNWEMLIVDDCSSDDSVHIIKEYCNKDSRIKLYKTEKPSGSPALPRNIGIENAQGEYIAFLDSDDVWLSDKLEKQIAFMEKNHYQLVYSFYEKMNWAGARENRVIRTRLQSTYSSLLKSNSIPCLTSVIRKNIIGSVRFKQIPQEDFCFWLDILKNGVVGYNYQEVTALYREAKKSRSANKLDMFKGYWNVIRYHQHISFIASCYYMITYSILGFAKYLK